MVDRKLTGAHYGLRDWLLQRITAFIMLVFTILFLITIICLPKDNFASWQAYFSNTFVQVITQIFVLAVAIHAWIGVRDIWMDYVKPTALRLSLHCITAVWLLGIVIYSVKVIWGV